ncbi:MAG: CsgG/HfaB family protein [Treponema sp.]|nr:CsgG/HfaB family protein [Treponema sp.]
MAVPAVHIQAQTSVVVVSKSPDTFAGQTVTIYVDGQKKLSISQNNTKFEIVVPDGSHTIYASQGLFKSNTFTFSANSSRIEFRTITQGLGMKLNKIGETPLMAADPGSSGSGRVVAAPAAARGAQRNSNIESALNKAAEDLMAEMKENSTVAVLSVSSRDREMREFVLEELAYILVDSGMFKVVDRRNLDTIRGEQNFQLGGEVDDGSAVSIGKLLGANIVITGSISGTEATRRLRLKALDVTTAEIVAMASEQF